MRFLIIAILAAITVSLSAQKKAITEDGARVLLHSDGTWAYENPSLHENVSKIRNLEGPDIRKSYWGDSFSKVKSLENIPSSEWIEKDQNGIIIRAFETQVAVMDALVVFYFVDDKLAGAKYVINENHLNDNEYVSDFNQLHEILSEKYGEQEIEEEWHDNTWRNDNSEKGYAIEQGHLDMSCTWETTTTVIYHEITGVDFRIEHAIWYRSKELQDLLNDRIDRSGIDVL